MKSLPRWFKLMALVASIILVVVFIIFLLNRIAPPPNIDVIRPLAKITIDFNSDQIMTTLYQRFRAGGYFSLEIEGSVAKYDLDNTQPEEHQLLGGRPMADYHLRHGGNPIMDIHVQHGTVFAVSAYFGYITKIKKTTESEWRIIDCGMYSSISDKAFANHFKNCKPFKTTRAQGVWEILIDVVN